MNKRNVEKNWQPLFHGASKRRAWQFIDKVDKELTLLEKNFQKGLYTKKWLLDGIGCSLFYHYLYKETGALEHQKRAKSFCNLAREGLYRLPVGDSLYTGFVGIAWLIEHLSKKSPGKANLNNEIDSYLVSKTRKGISKKTPLGMYGLADDWVGYGVYALECWPHGKSGLILENIVRLLDKKAKRSNQGITWFSTKKALSHHPKSGHYNLGVAHGVPGVIGFLTEVLKANICKELTLDLLNNSIKWLLAHDSGRHYNYFLLPNGRREPKKKPRLAWCYGDLGISMVLLNAARALKDSQLGKRALAIAHRATEFSYSASRVTDPYFCHGSSGVFHVFKALYQTTGDAQFLDAAKIWGNETLKMIERPRKFSDPEFDLLTGRPGIALALISGISKTPPEWDRLLLISPF